MSAVKFSKQYIEPNPSEVDYWIDLASSPYGSRIKYNNGVDWVDLFSSGGSAVSLDNYFNKTQINQMLSTKASVESVDTKVDDTEIAEVIKNIEIKNRDGSGIELVLLKYDDTTVGVSLPVASSTTSGVLTADEFKNMVKQYQLQELYTEMYDKLAEIRSLYQPRLSAGKNIKIDRTTNTIHATGKISTDWNDLSNVPELAMQSDLEAEVKRATETESALDTKIQSHVTVVETELDLKANKADTYTKSQIDSKLSGVYRIKGSCLFEQLPTNPIVGDTWNIINDFTLNGEEHPFGTNIVYTDNGWDALAGIFDSSELAGDISGVAEALSQETIRAVKAEQANADNINDVRASYLPLSGGVVKGVTTISGDSKTRIPLVIDTPAMENIGYIKFANNGATIGFLGMAGLDKPVFRNSSNDMNYTLWHSGNLTPTEILTQLKTVDGSGSGLDADRLDEFHNYRGFLYWNSVEFRDTTNSTWYVKIVFNEAYNYVPKKVRVTGSYNNTKGFVELEIGSYEQTSGYIAKVTNYNGCNCTGFHFIENSENITGSSRLTLWLRFRGGTSASTKIYSQFGVLESSKISAAEGSIVPFVDINTSHQKIFHNYELNASSATKLQTARTIWGQSFDGTGNVNGHVFMDNNASIIQMSSDGVALQALYTTENNNLNIGYSHAEKGYNTYINGNNIYLRYGTSPTLGMVLNSSGNITIGSSDLASTNHKLYVDGSSFSKSVKIGGAQVTDGSKNIEFLASDDTVRARISYNGNTSDGLWHFDSAYAHMAMATRSGAYLGVGTTSPAYKLDVNGIGCFRDTSSQGKMVRLGGGIGIYSRKDTSTEGSAQGVTAYGYSGTNLGSMSGSMVTGDKLEYFYYGKSYDNSPLNIYPSGNISVGGLSDTNTLSVLGTLSVSGATTLYGGATVNKNLKVIGTDNHVVASFQPDPNVLNEIGIVELKGTGKYSTRLDIYDASNSYVNVRLDEGHISIGELDDWYGVSWSENSADPTCTRIGNMAMHRSLPILSAMKRYWLLSGMNDVLSEFFIPIGNDGSLEFASIDNGRSKPTSNWTNGSLFVKIPEFWYIDEYDGVTKTHNLKLSQTAKAGWCHHKEAYVGAYEGYDDGTYYRSLIGKIPTVSATREQLRAKARANGYEGESKWNIYTYEEHRAICHLFLVEYATRNSQLAVNPTLTAEGFRQGGLGSGCTTGTMNGAYSFIPTGTTDSLGNGSGQVAYTASNGTTYYANRYRGIENPFGHIWKYVDDIVNVYNAETTYKTVYKCNKPEHFATNKNAKYKPLCSFPGGSKMKGWSKEIKATINCDFFKYSVGGSETTYWCDYNYDNDDASEHCLLIGGASDYGVEAGLFYFYLHSGVGYSSVHIGSRLTYLPWAE